MAGQRDVDLPDAVDRLLRHELSLEPSAAFLPRVRERIDHESASASWNWWSWMTSAAAAAAVCAVIAVVTMAKLGVVAPPSAPPAPTVVQPFRAAPTTPVVVQPFRAAPVVQPFRVAQTAVARGGPSPIDAPAILVDERQRTALAAMVRMIRDGRLTEDTLAATGRTSLQPIREQVTPVGVKPVELSPIAVGGVQQTEK